MNETSSTQIPANETAYRAVFFDLDGTLLPMDLHEFLHGYMSLLTEFAGKKGMEVASFQQGLNAGIAAMAKDDSSRCNAEVFWDTFFGFVSEEPEQWTPIFEEFYENDFGTVGKNVVANPVVAKSLALLKEKGYPLVLTTMPMFPPRAVAWRCEWAGVDAAIFERITTFENSTSVKPKLTYFKENLQAAGLKPEEVLMVGNNTLEDLACMELGMDAFLITDHLINPNEFDIEQVRHGSFDEFYAWIEKLPLCENPARDIVATLPSEQ